MGNEKDPDDESFQFICNWKEMKCYCSDFRYESNGIFVLGVGFFFLQTNFDFLTSHFWQNFFYHSKSIVVLSLNLKKFFTCDHFS